MNSKLIEILQKAEKLAGINPDDNLDKIPYKVFDNVWIRADKTIGEIYSKSVKNSELLFYPNTNYKAWGVWFLKVLGLRKSGYSLKDFLGIGIRWPFLNKQYLPLSADIVYYRTHSIILIYSSLETKKVIKVSLTSWGKTLMEAEIKSQNLAYPIQSEDVFIPAILKEFSDENLHFSVEEYFDGQSQSFGNKDKLRSNYRKVFQFLLEFYLKNPIELQSLKKSEYLNHQFVENFICEQDNGVEVISLFKSLYVKKKKMILCRIHGDLNHNNVLSNREQVCIIDWGKSKQHYLSRDLDNSSYNTERVFDVLIERAKIDREKIYTYREQLFLGRFIEMNRLIYNGIRRKTVTADLYLWTKSQNIKLLEMAKNL